MKSDFSSFPALLSLIPALRLCCSSPTTAASGKRAKKKSGKTELSFLGDDKAFSYRLFTQ